MATHVEGDDAFHILPSDIIEAVFSRLPSKPLSRFKSVSRSWNARISDPRFIRSHHELSVDSCYSQNLFMAQTREGFVLVRISLEDNGRKLFQIESKLEIPDGWSEFVNCRGNGVVLLIGTGPTDSYDQEVFSLLWNPCSRKETMLRLPRASHDHDPIVRGICHDPNYNDDDFKVVFAFPEFYQVFSCKNNSWTRRDQQFPCKFVAYSEGLAVNGALYWVWSAKGPTDPTRYDLVDHYSYKNILCFDSRDDSFKTLEKPEGVKDHKGIRLICLRGCLCLYTDGGDVGDGFGMSSLQIWIKERDRNSWKVLMNVENLERQSNLCSFRLIPVFMDNKILIVSNQRFLIYNSSDKTYQEFRYSLTPHYYEPQSSKENNSA
ncbi:putative F-box protein at3g23260 [Phtheirospermum japonicum]|uniref:Putative F-box protein at3g23260 n=2 Tax=Phtheirospermum japonicum TaxID=374723 RepID=A0A830D574_9LAMI|nr:putative F-box protein at3g23260 [Phtheirospermum japonicum]